MYTLRVAQFRLALACCGLLRTTEAFAQNLDVKGTITGEGNASFLQNVDVNGTITTRNLAMTGLSGPGLVPTGAVMAFAGSAAPAGWLMCDGTSKSRAEFPALFAVIGTTYGAEDGAHFTVPDLRSRVVVGAGQGTGRIARAPASTGGQETVTLTAAQSGLPAHAHNFGGGSLNDFQQSMGVATGTGTYVPGTGSVSNAGTTGTVAAAGAATSHENMPPFLVLNYIIKK